MKKFNLVLLLQFIVVLSFGQLSIYGVVTDEGKEPLAGASVVIKNTYNGVSTNDEGSFIFNNLKAGKYWLVTSFIGYEKKEIAIELNEDKEVRIQLEAKNILTEEILISATRANNNTPFAYTNVSNEEIAARNMGQDIPYMLTMTPSYVATSDAGAGVGYTNFRIRGTDLNRINVTVNGIPLNDAESHGTWFVDLPDLASSTENIQVQRGVGTSTNGAASFGATINMQTSDLEKKAYAKYSTAFGSFNTQKYSLSAGSGLLKEKFTVDMRLSKVSSDGYIDRASSDLKSFFISAGYYGANTIIKANVFSGFEETYQAWYGVPSVKLNNDIIGMQHYRDHWLWDSNSARANEIKYEELINSDARTYNFYTYKNEVDHYQQDHYQLHFSHKLYKNMNINAALHYTYGRGYYENYEYDESFADYLLPNIIEGAQTIESTDLVNRKWLDNDFYGMVFSLNYDKNKSAFTFGGGWNTYDGLHYGRVIWGEYLAETNYGHEWYRGTGLKKDFNIYGKYNYELSEQVNLYADLQYRHIDYSIDGIDDDLRNISQEHTFNFFNPKFGLFYKPEANQELFLSYARANREPNRSNYVDADPDGKEPVHETLNDIEVGFNIKESNYFVGFNFYHMHYKNQLILTGEINDVGAPIMVNVDKSHRTGIEITSGIKVTRNLQWDINATLSKNKLVDFAEFVDNWDTGEQVVDSLGDTDIAFSPEIIVNSQIKYSHLKNLNFYLLSNYVSDQFIDNTSKDDRKLDAYFINSFKADYIISPGFFKEITFHLMVNNFLNEKYESNAWVYSYIYGGERYKMDGYFPQAGTNFMIGVDFKF